MLVCRRLPHVGLYTAKSVFVILSLDSLLSGLTCIPVYLSLKYAAGERPAQFEGWLWVIYPFVIYFSGAQVQPPRLQETSRER